MQRERWRGSTAILVVLSVLAAISMGYRFAILPMAPTVDSLFTYGFNYAAATGLAWGRDFVSTCGPYGYLILTMDVGDLVKRAIVFNLLLAIGTGLAIAAYVQSVPAPGAGARIMLAIVLAYAASLPGAEYRWFVLFLLLLLAGIHLRERMSLVAFFLAGVLGGFYVLVKFSLGMNAVMTVLVACFLTRRLATVGARLAVVLPAATGSFLAGWLAYERGFAGIKDHLITGWAVGVGYSAAMSFVPERWWIGVASVLVWFALIVLWVVVQSGPYSRLALAALAVPLFGAWKHSIVRQDVHVMILVTYGVFVIVILVIEASVAQDWRWTLPIASTLLVPLTVAWFNAAPAALNPMTSLEEVALAPLKLRGVTDLARLGELDAYRETIARESESYLRQHVLPRSLRTTIGESSVDVYPWRIFFVPANGLSWANRPVPPSYNAYTPLLDGIDTAFFESRRRPTHLIWHATNEAGVRSIDGRYLLWDEPRTVRAIIDSYDIVAAASNVMVLRVRRSPRFGPPKLLGTVRVAWDTWIRVPQSAGVLLANVSVEPSLVVPIVRAVFREDPVYLSVRFPSGEAETYRVVRDNMKSGIWLSPFAVTIAELESLFHRGAARPSWPFAFRAGGFSPRPPLSACPGSNCRCLPREPTGHGDGGLHILDMCAWSAKPAASQTGGSNDVGASASHRVDSRDRGLPCRNRTFSEKSRFLAGRSAPKIEDPIDPRCRDLARPPQLDEDKRLRDRGWDLVGAYQGGWQVLVIRGTAGYDGMCRPRQYQDFVFVRGVFAGTLSPQAMDSRADGALGRVSLQSDSRLSAQYHRYASTDPLCCPSRTTSVVFDIAIDPLVLRPVSASTSDASQTARPRSGDVKPLEGTRWKAIELAGKPAPTQDPKREAHLQFQTGGRVSGSDGCNRLAGTYQLDGDRVTFGQMVGTQMACLNPSGTEGPFRDALKRAARWTVAGDRLELFDTNGAPVAVFSAGPQASAASPSSGLIGTSWQLVKVQGSDDTTLMPNDRAKYTIKFAAGGRLTAHVDCNRGRSTWRSSGSNQIEFGPLALTRAKCPAGSLHDQIVKQWGNIRSYVIRDGHLFLALMADGGINEFEPIEKTK